MERDLGLNRVQSSLAFSLALTEGMAAYPVGADRPGAGASGDGGWFVGWPRCASACTRWVDMAAGFMRCGWGGRGHGLRAYNPVLLVTRRPVALRRGIITMTFWAFGQQMFIPAGDWPIRHLGWREALQVLAGCICWLCALLHAVAARGNNTNGG